MKLNRVSKFLLLFILMGIFSPIHGKVQAIFSHKKFLMNGKKPFIETYLLIRGTSVKFKKNEFGKYQGSLEVVLSISKSGKIFYADKYNLNSPESADSTGHAFNFIDQQRVSLDTGNYQIEVSIRDILSADAAEKASDYVKIDFPDDVCFSDIQLVSSYEKSKKPGKLTKSGLDLIPHIADLYTPDENNLILYAEIYNALKLSGAEEKFLVNYFIENKQSQIRYERYSGFKRLNASEVAVFMHEINIESLPGGAYSIVLEARDKNNTLLASKKQDIIRNNPGIILSPEAISQTNVGGSFAEKYTNKDSLADFINSLRPISFEMEKTYVDNLLEGGDLKMMQQYFLTFWSGRSPENPESAWLTYSKEVVKAQKDFGTSIRRGYETDRGRVFLQYGPPDNRTVSLHEPSAYPYEIWHYYRLKKQSNRRFVFYNPDLVTNDYTLIHSDALGEIMNDQWQFLIMKRDSQTNDIDATSPNQHFGTQIQQNYQAPR